MPDRRRLLLHARLPAGHRRPRCRCARPGRHAGAGPGHPLRGAADVSPGGEGEPARRRQPVDAGAAAVVLAEQAPRAGPDRVRRDRVHHHHHPLRRRRHRPPGREPVPAPRRCTASEVWLTLVPAGAAGGGLPQGVRRGHRHRRRPRRRLHRAQRGRRRRTGSGTSSQNPGTFSDWTDAVTDAHASPLAVLGRVPAGLPRAGAGPVRVRDRGRGHAAGQGRRRRHGGRADGTHPQRQASCSPPPRWSCR